MKKNIRKSLTVLPIVLGCFAATYEARAAQSATVPSTVSLTSSAAILGVGPASTATDVTSNPLSGGGIVFFENGNQGTLDYQNCAAYEDDGSDDSNKFRVKVAYTNNNGVQISFKTTPDNGATRTSAAGSTTFQLGTANGGTPATLGYNIHFTDIVYNRTGNVTTFAIGAIKQDHDIVPSVANSYTISGKSNTIANIGFKGVIPSTLVGHTGPFANYCDIDPATHNDLKDVVTITLMAL